MSHLPEKVERAKERLYFIAISAMNRGTEHEGYMNGSHAARNAVNDILDALHDERLFATHPAVPISRDLITEVIASTQVVFGDGENTGWVSRKSAQTITNKIIDELSYADLTASGGLPEAAASAPSTGVGTRNYEITKRAIELDHDKDCAIHRMDIPVFDDCSCGASVKYFRQLLEAATPDGVVERAANIIARTIAPSLFASPSILKRYDYLEVEVRKEATKYAQALASAGLLHSRDEVLEEAAQLAEIDADWIKREDQERTSWGKPKDAFTLPSDGIPWDKVGRWSYAMGLLAGSKIAKAIRALKSTPIQRGE